MSNRVSRALRSHYKRINTALNFRRIHGPRSVSLSTADVVAVCLIKNGEFFLERFLEHHFRLGIKHVVLVDNGSTDDTVSIARRHRNVSIVQSQLKVNEYECLLRAEAVRRYAGKNWCLVVDADEMFDYPHSELIDLQRMIGYLNRERFNAVVAQMLDMIPDGPLPAGAETNFNYEDLYNHYDLDAVSAYDYHDTEQIEFAYFLKDNSIGNPDIRFLFGGIRKQLFGTDNCLTKHPLIRCVYGLKPITHPHCSSNVKCADFSALLRHYKFAGDLQRRVAHEIRMNVWDHDESAAILARLQDSADLVFRQPTSSRYSGAADLLRQGFLVTSSRYFAYAKSHGASPTSTLA